MRIPVDQINLRVVYLPITIAVLMIAVQFAGSVPFDWRIIFVSILILMARQCSKHSLDDYERFNEVVKKNEPGIAQVLRYVALFVLTLFLWISVIATATQWYQGTPQWILIMSCVGIVVLLTSCYKEKQSQNLHWLFGTLPYWLVLIMPLITVAMSHKSFVINCFIVTALLAHLAYWFIQRQKKAIAAKMLILALCISAPVLINTVSAESVIATVLCLVMYLFCFVALYQLSFMDDVQSGTPDRWLLVALFLLPCIMLVQ